MKKELKERISDIFSTHKDIFIQLSKDRPKWNIRGEWWNIKYYEDQGTDDMTILHKIAGSTREEVPVNPCIFFARKTRRRFNLQDVPIAYFSSDASIAMCETVDELRNNPNLLWEEELKDYLAGDMDVNESIFGMPLPYEVSDDALILDIHDTRTKVMRFLEDDLQMNGTQILRLLSTRKEHIYEITEHISAEAYRAGFHGIAYKSARTTRDVQIIGHNLVLFDENKASRFRLGP